MDFYTDSPAYLSLHELVHEFAVQHETIFASLVYTYSLLPLFALIWFFRAREYEKTPPKPRGNFLDNPVFFCGSLIVDYAILPLLTTCHFIFGFLVYFVIDSTDSLTDPVNRPRRSRRARDDPDLRIQYDILKQIHEEYLHASRTKDLENQTTIEDLINQSNQRVQERDLHIQQTTDAYAQEIADHENEVSSAIAQAKERDIKIDEMKKVQDTKINEMLTAAADAKRELDRTTKNFQETIVRQNERLAAYDIYWKQYEEGTAVRRNPAYVRRLEMEQRILKSDYEASQKTCEEKDKQIARLRSALQKSNIPSDASPDGNIRPPKYVDSTSEPTDGNASEIDLSGSRQAGPPSTRPVSPPMSIDTDRVWFPDEAETQTLYNMNFPRGHELIPTLGKALKCGFNALIESYSAQLGTELVELKVEDLEKLFAKHFPDAQPRDLEDIQISRLWYHWGCEYKQDVQLGIYMHDDTRLVIREVEEPTGPLVTLWIHNTSAEASGEAYGHWSGMRYTTLPAGPPSIGPPLAGSPPPGSPPTGQSSTGPVPAGSQPLRSSPAGPTPAVSLQAGPQPPVGSAPTAPLSAGPPPPGQYPGYRRWNFDSDATNALYQETFPLGHDLIPTSGAGLKCGFYALLNSYSAQFPNGARLTIKWLEDCFASNFPGKPPANLEELQISKLWHLWARQNETYAQLGIYLPNSTARVICEEQNPNPNGGIFTLWIHNNNRETKYTYGHWSGMRPSVEQKAFFQIMMGSMYLALGAVRQIQDQQGGQDQQEQSSASRQNKEPKDVKMDDPAGQNTDELDSQPAQPPILNDVSNVQTPQAPKQRLEQSSPMEVDSEGKNGAFTDPGTTGAQSSPVASSPITPTVRSPTPEITMGGTTSPKSTSIPIRNATVIDTTPTTRTPPPQSHASDPTAAATNTSDDGIMVIDTPPQAISPPIRPTNSLLTSLPSFPQGLLNNQPVILPGVSTTPSKASLPSRPILGTPANAGGVSSDATPQLQPVPPSRPASPLKSTSTPTPISPPKSLSPPKSASTAKTASQLQPIHPAQSSADDDDQVKPAARSTSPSSSISDISSTHSTTQPNPIFTQLSDQPDATVQATPDDPYHAPGEIVTGTVTVVHDGGDADGTRSEDNVDYGSIESLAQGAMNSSDMPIGSDLENTDDNTRTEPRIDLTAQSVAAPGDDIGSYSAVTTQSGDPSGFVNPVYPPAPTLPPPSQSVPNVSPPFMGPVVIGNNTSTTQGSINRADEDEAKQSPGPEREDSKSGDSEDDNSSRINSDEDSEVDDDSMTDDQRAEKRAKRRFDEANSIKKRLEAVNQYLNERNNALALGMSGEIIRIQIEVAYSEQSFLERRLRRIAESQNLHHDSELWSFQEEPMEDPYRELSLDLDNEANEIRRKRREDEKKAREQDDSGDAENGDGDHDEDGSGNGENEGGNNGELDSEEEDFLERVREIEEKQAAGEKESKKGGRTLQRQCTDD